jgi:[acyl-carrier-protein] S-malonyltransferase
MSADRPVVALLCPGQGAQRPGFVEPWLAEPTFRAVFTELSQASGLDLVEHGTTSDAATIQDTAIAQPLIVAASLAAAAVLTGDRGLRVDVVAGHSVGEVSAAAVAGVLSGPEAVAFVAERGRAMAAASALEATGMSAVLGGDPAAVRAELEQERGVTAANVNGAGQLVAAGSRAALDELAANPPAGTQVKPLRVAGAFHTSYMQPATPSLARVAARLTPADARITLLSNADGEPVTHGPEVLSRLVGQVTRQVRWDLCLATLARLGVTQVVELPPSGALTGLVRRELPGVVAAGIRRPKDLSLLDQTLAESG